MDKVKIMEALEEFVIRVSSDKNATEAEVAALPEVAMVLLNYELNGTA